MWTHDRRDKYSGYDHQLHSIQCTITFIMAFLCHVCSKWLWKMNGKERSANGERKKTNKLYTHTLQHVDGSKPGGRFPLGTGSICKIWKAKRTWKRKNLENLYTMFRKLRNKRKPYNILTWWSNVKPTYPIKT